MPLLDLMGLRATLDLMALVSMGVDMVFGMPQGQVIPQE